MTISQDNGKVYLTRYSKKYAVWVQCPTCGPSPPRLKHVPHAIDGEIMTTLDFGDNYCHDELVCSGCGEKGVRRECLIPVRQGAGRCGKRCWNGKYECACVCEGLCHSEGECFCKKEGA